jgi:predicted Zn-dependent protease
LRTSHGHRARAFDALKNYGEAAKDWDRVIELCPANEKMSLRASCAHSRVRAGMIVEAVAEVAELTKSSKWDSGQWYGFACVYSVASKTIAGAKKQEYADQAIVLLRSAMKAGYKDLSHIKNDSDLDALRPREEFKKLIAELEATSLHREKM